MTFEVAVTVGAWTRYVTDPPQGSNIKLWIAREGQAPELIIDKDFNIRTPEEAWRRYGKVWLLPYMTGRSFEQIYPEGHVWYDELIVSRHYIAFP